MKEWISVSDYLPDERLLCITYDTNGDTYIAYLYEKESNIWHTDVHGEDINVTHWILLPLPPNN